MSGYPWLCILVGGPTIRIATNHGVVGFEWHDYLGPMPVSLKRGHEGDGRLLKPGHDFWNKVTDWAQAGRPTHTVNGQLWASPTEAQP